MRMGQEIGHIEPNASSADERHPIPDFDITAENGVIRHSVGQIGPGMDGTLGLTPAHPRWPRTAPLQRLFS